MHVKLTKEGISMSKVLLGTVAGFLGFATTVNAVAIYGVTDTRHLIQFDSATPGTIDSSLAITGIGTEGVLAIDARPATGELFALGSASNIYRINPNTGAATLVGAIGTPLNGSQFGFDFNPTIDRIRIVSETDRNYVVNPITGALQLVATNLFYPTGDLNVGVNPNVTAVAYTNSVSGTVPTTSQLYAIDTGIDILATQANNTGVLGTVGPLLTVNAAAVTGFDIYSPVEGNNTAFAALMPAGGSVSNLYTINLATGTAVLVGQIDGGLNIVDITVAISPVPEPTSLALAGAASLVLRRRRR